MMRKTWSRAAALTLTGAMALSLTACGGGKESNNTTAGNTSTDGKPTITFMATSFHGTDLKNDQSDKVIQMYEDYTGIHVDWRWENNDTYKEKFGLTLMDKENMPMILTAQGDLQQQANVVDAARKGAFWDLTPFLQDAEAYPNLSKADPDVMKALTVNNQVIGVYRARALGRYGLSYRTDWAEAVGITEAPKTVEDVYNMLYKFTYEDPDGNGKDDTYGLEMTKYTGPLDIMQTWFGAGNEWVEQDGKLVPVHQTAEYKEALTWLKKIYDDGLIRRDWATVDSGTFQDGCKKGEAGVFIDVIDGGQRIWKYFIDNGVMSVTDPSQPASMTLVGPVNDKTLATTGFNGFYLITKAGAKTEEDVKNCLTFLDKMCDDEMMVLADYGLEGVTYELNEKGNVVNTWTKESQYSPSAGLNQALAYIPNQMSTNPVLEMDEPKTKQYEIYAYNEPFVVKNPAMGYLANSEVNAEVGTDIEQIIEDARTQYICGQIDDAGFEVAAKQWMDRGGDRLIEEINKLYQEDTTK